MLEQFNGDPPPRQTHDEVLPQPDHVVVPAGEDLTERQARQVRALRVAPSRSVTSTA